MVLETNAGVFWEREHGIPINILRPVQHGPAPSLRVSRCGGWSSWSTELDLESPWKHNFEYVYMMSPERLRTYSECGWHYATNWSAGLNKGEKVGCAPAFSQPPTDRAVPSHSCPAFSPVMYLISSYAANWGSVLRTLPLYVVLWSVWSQPWGKEVTHTERHFPTTT